MNYIEVPVTATDPGNLTVPHPLGHVPVGAKMMLTSGELWWQSPTKWDATNLYLVASAAGASGKVVVW